MDLAKIGAYAGKNEFHFYNPAKILLYIKELEEKAVVFADLHASNVCNHSCIWCRYVRNNEMLSLDSMIDLLERYPKIKGMTITGGGEPLTNKQIFEFILECRRREIETGLFTNGSLFDQRGIDIIGDNCQFCRISLDAATPETHAKTHQSRDFERIIWNIRKLGETKLPELGISYLVTPETVDDIVLLSDLGLPVDYIHFKPLIEGIDEQTKKKALRNIGDLQKRVDYALRNDRIEQDLMCNHKIKCRVTGLITNPAANGKEYVCCEHAGEEEFERGRWNGSTAKCHTCRFNNYNEILDLYYKNTFSKEFL